MFIITVFYSPVGSGWIIGVGELRNSSIALGLAIPEGLQARAIVQAVGNSFFFHDRFTSFRTHASLLTFFCLFVLFHSCFHARVFGKTLVHEFHISIAILNCTCCFPTVRLHVRNVYSERKSRNTCTNKPEPLNYISSYEVNRGIRAIVMSMYPQMRKCWDNTSV